MPIRRFPPSSAELFVVISRRADLDLAGTGYVGMLGAVPGLDGVGVTLGQGDGFGKFAVTAKLDHSVVDGA